MSRSERITEVFDDGGALYDGYARITIQRLIPRAEGEAVVQRPIKQRRKRDE